MLAIQSSNLTIMVKDMDKAIEFYTNQLGLKLVQRWGNHYAQVEAPGILIGLHPAKGKDTHSGTVSIGFAISDVKEAKNKLSEQKIGYTESEDEVNLLVHFHDLDGTALYFIQPKAGHW